MVGKSIAEDIDSSFTAVPAVSQELLPSQEADDIFLTIQRATFVVSKIYNDLFAKSRADFVSELSELCCTFNDEFDAFYGRLYKKFLTLSRMPNRTVLF